MWMRIKHFFTGHNFYEFIYVRHGVFTNRKTTSLTTSGDASIFICDCGKVAGEVKLYPVRKYQAKSAFGLPMEEVKE